MANKPVVVITQQGTDVGNFIPNITQFIILDGTQEDYNEKEFLIKSLLNSACEMAENADESKVSAEFIDFVIKALAVIGGAALLNNIFNKNDVTIQLN